MNVQNLFRNTTLNLLPSFPACNTLSTIQLHVQHGRKELWSWNSCLCSSYNKSVSEKKKSNPVLCYCYYMNCTLMGKNFQNFQTADERF